MQFINHRVNTLTHLASVPSTNGVEIDVRYHMDDLILHHDPYSHHRSSPIKLKEYLRGWAHTGPLILNIKTEGIELDCIQLMTEFDICNWFFLDLSMPYFAMFSEKARRREIKKFGPENLAVRFSELEPIEYALSFSGSVGWVWVDCFENLPLDVSTAEVLKSAGFRICIVSPELQKHSLDRIQEFREKLSIIPVDAICTKRPDLWENESDVRSI